MGKLEQEVRFDRDLLTPQYLADPYVYYRELREAAPIWFSERMNAWVVSRYEDVHAGLKDPRLISGQRVDAYLDPLPPDVRATMTPLTKHVAKWIGNIDPPDHTRLRALVNKAFTPRMVEGLKPLVMKIIDELLSDAIRKGQMDFIADFAYPLPAIVIAEMLGVPPEDRDLFMDWSKDLMAFTGTGRPDVEVLKSARDAAAALQDYFINLLNKRRDHAQDDLISVLAQVEEAGEKLNEQELLSMCGFLIVAGHETTMSLLGNGMLALLRHPEQLNKLRENPQLAASAVEELLRYDSPIQHQTRGAGETFQWQDQTIEQNQRVILMLGSANRDPQQFPDPDTLDIARKPNRHMAFGYGIHYCLGAPLARLEGQMAFNEVFRRLPAIELKDDAIEYRKHTSNRNPMSLQVGF
jgi:cytochrome P450